MKNESNRPLVGAITRITLDSHFSHRIWPKGSESLPID
jgi:hypothetical protein